VSLTFTPLSSLIALLVQVYDVDTFYIHIWVSVPFILPDMTYNVFSGTLNPTQSSEE